MTNITTNLQNHITKRTITRILASQASYLMLFDNNYQNMEKIEEILLYLDEVKIILHLDNPDAKYLLKIIESLSVNFDTINQKIEPILQKNWSLARINLISLSIIKTAICELIISEKLDRPIIINEYANIASQVLDSKDVDFINALLNKV